MGENGVLPPQKCPRTFMGLQRAAEFYIIPQMDEPGNLRGQHSLAFIWKMGGTRNKLMTKITIQIINSSHNVRDLTLAFPPSVFKIVLVTNFFTWNVSLDIYGDKKALLETNVWNCVKYEVNYIAIWSQNNTKSTVFSHWEPLNIVLDSQK